MKLKIILFIFFAIAIAACKDELNSPLEKEASISGNVSNVVVKNIPGGATLTYSVPGDPNFLYVLAEVKTKSGKVRQFKASHYINTLKIDGLSDTNSYEVKLYAVNKSEAKSEPVSVEISPLQPPFRTVYKTVQITEDFGGVNVKFLNETEADLGLILYATDSLGEFKQYGTLYSKAKNVSYTFRGMRSEKTKIGVFVRDRWENASDTLINEVTPLHEEMIKKPYVDVTFPTDAPLYVGLSYIAKHYMWDGRWSTVFSNPYNPGLNLTTLGPNDGVPLHVTFALTNKARLSRMRVSNYYQYQNRTMRKYEIWGHPGVPPSDGSWGGWIKLATHEQVKPSGLPLGGYTAEDKKAWEDGDNFNLLADAPAIKYIRIKCLLNWTGNSNMAIAEVTLWGSER